MSSSSIPCYEAYVLSSTAVSFGTVSATLATIAFAIYFYRLHRNPNMKVMQNKYDIESASWVMVLASIGALSVSTSVILNYQCGEHCPAATIQCNTQMGSAGAALIASIGSAGAAVMKLLSIKSQKFAKAGYTNPPTHHDGNLQS